MKSRKMVLTNLLTGQQWRNRHRLMDMGTGEERVRCMESNMETYITMCKIDRTGICCVAQETQTGALYQPRGVGSGGRWEGGSKGRGYMHTYG